RTRRMSPPRRVASTQSNRPRRRPRSPLVAFEPAARSQAPPNDRTNHTAETKEEPSTLLRPLRGNRERAVSASSGICCADGRGSRETGRGAGPGSQRLGANGVSDRSGSAPEIVASRSYVRFILEAAEKRECQYRRFGVIRVVLAVDRSLPAYPDEQTF